MGNVCQSGYYMVNGVCQERKINSSQSTIHRNCCNDPKSPYKSLCSEYCDKNASPDITCPNGCLNLGKKGDTQMSIEFRKGLVIEKGNSKYKYGIVSNGGPKQQDNLFKITNFRGTNLEIDGKKQRVGTLGKGGIVINNWRMQVNAIYQV